MGAALAHAAYEKLCWHCTLENNCHMDVISGGLLINVKQLDHCLDVAAGRCPSIVD